MIMAIQMQHCLSEYRTGSYVAKDINFYQLESIFGRENKEMEIPAVADVVDHAARDFMHFNRWVVY